MTPTLEDLRDHLDNMYDQLDAEQINHWPIAGLELTIDDKTFVIRLEQV